MDTSDKYKLLDFWQAFLSWLCRSISEVYAASLQAIFSKLCYRNIWPICAAGLLVFFQILFYRCIWKYVLPDFRQAVYSHLSMFPCGGKFSCIFWFIFLRVMHACLFSLCRGKFSCLCMRILLPEGRSRLSISLCGTVVNPLRRLLIHQPPQKQ